MPEMIIPPMSNSFSSFSGADIVATVQVTDKSVQTIGELQTITYSTHREIIPVRGLGRINASGFVRGGRTIAGSLIFTVFDKAFIRKMIEDVAVEGEKLGIVVPSRILADEMPPFNITISFANELGLSATIRLMHVLIVNEGQVMSVNDIMTENSMNFIAREIESMTPGVRR
jgi:hypothetical protein